MGIPVLQQMHCSKSQCSQQVMYTKVSITKKKRFIALFNMSLLNRYFKCTLICQVSLIKMMIWWALFRVLIKKIRKKCQPIQVSSLIGLLLFASLQWQLHWRWVSSLYKEITVQAFALSHTKVTVYPNRALTELQPMVCSQNSFWHPLDSQVIKCATTQLFLILSEIFLCPFILHRKKYISRRPIPCINAMTLPTKPFQSWNIFGHFYL